MSVGREKKQTAAELLLAILLKHKLEFVGGSHINEKRVVNW